jgi:ATP-binding cassette, subfamily C, bacterial LapB
MRYMTETDLPTKPWAQATDESVAQDVILASLLSRLAALQGHAVAAYLLGSTQSNASGLSLDGLGRTTKAMEIWAAHFPEGQALEISGALVNPHHFPLLWLSQDETQIYLVKGQLSSGTCVAEDEQGKPVELSKSGFLNGHVLVLKPELAATDSGQALPQSAGEWFAYALGRYRGAFSQAVFATFIVSSIGLFAALYTMQVYDRVVPSKGYSTLLVLSVGVVIAILMELLIKQVRAHMVERACKAIDQELSSVFFGKALDIRMDARPRTVGTFASQIRHFESVRNFLTSSTLFILADAPFAILFIGVIAMISPEVAVVPLIMVPLSVLAGMFFRKPIENFTAEHMAESNKKNGLLIESIDGIESIKAGNGEWKMLDRWRKLTATIAQSELRMRALTTLSSNLTQTLQQLTYVGMVAVGAYAITNGDLTMGGLIACTIISGRALSPLAQVPGLIAQWKHAQIALKGLDGIMALPSDRDAVARQVVPQSCQGQLRLEKISFAYGEDKPILDIASLSIQPGERIGVLGSIGSGKSSLIKVLSGLYQPKTGHVFLDGSDILHLAPQFVREHIGYLPQDVRLFQGSLRDNLTLGLASPGDSQILRVAAMTGLDQLIQSHSKGLELEITEGGKGLSGGQRQLAGLTRMLLLQPRIMLLDEPTASMDGQSENRIIEHLFKEISPQSVLVIVTHKPALLAHIGRILVMDQGRIVLDGPRDTVLARLRSATKVTARTESPNPTGAQDLDVDKTAPTGSKA